MYSIEKRQSYPQTVLIIPEHPRKTINFDTNSVETKFNTKMYDPPLKRIPPKIVLGMVLFIIWGLNWIGIHCTMDLYVWNYTDLFFVTAML
eukprot:6472595-Amphidinium_carterae.1